jgi:hypothetical protein
MTDSPGTRAYVPGEPGRVPIDQRPATGQTPPTDTREMLVVHGALRREFRLAAEVVRAAAIGDLARAKVVTRHLHLLMGLLHHHHEIEDQLLWAPLLARVGEEHAPTVLLMEAQHERIAARLDELREATAGYLSHPSVQRQATLATLCEHVYALLDEHLAAEEGRLLPLATEHLSTEEWAQISARANRGIAKREQLLCFGSMMYEGDPAVIERMLATAPLPVRLLVPRLGGRAYARHALKVYGTPTP